MTRDGGARACRASCLPSPRPEPSPSAPGRGGGLRRSATVGPYCGGRGTVARRRGRASDAPRESRAQQRRDEDEQRRESDARQERDTADGDRPSLAATRLRLDTRLVDDLELEPTDLEERGGELRPVGLALQI